MVIIRSLWSFLVLYIHAFSKCPPGSLGSKGQEFLFPGVFVHLLVYLCWLVLVLSHDPESYGCWGLDREAMIPAVAVSCSLSFSQCFVFLFLN